MPTSPSATCSIKPNPVSLGDLYEIEISLPSMPNTRINVHVIGSGGGNYFMRMTDANGISTVEWYANWEGPNIVEVYSNTKKPKLLTKGTFNVVI